MSRPNRTILTLGATIAMLALVGTAMAADPRDGRRGIRQNSQGLYETTRVLEYSGNECVRVPNCISIESPRTVVGPDQIRVLAVQCPAGHPVPWHWDTEQHEHILVRLTGRTPHGLTFSIRNLANASGQTRIFVGCSSQPFSVAASGLQQSRTGIPTRQQPPQGDAQ
jgi:hypothetical protein